MTGSRQTTASAHLIQIEFGGVKRDLVPKKGKANNKTWDLTSSVDAVSRGLISSSSGKDSISNGTSSILISSSSKVTFERLLGRSVSWEGDFNMDGSLQ